MSTDSTERPADCLSQGLDQHETKSLAAISFPLPSSSTSAPLLEEELPIHNPAELQSEVPEASATADNSNELPGFDEALFEDSFYTDNGLHRAQITTEPERASLGLPVDPQWSSPSAEDILSQADAEVLQRASDIPLWTAFYTAKKMLAEHANFSVLLDDEDPYSRKMPSNRVPL